jgi:ankyrin repeat protein
VDPTCRLPTVFSDWYGKDKNGARVLEILRKQGVRISLEDEGVYETAILQTVRYGLPGVLREWLKLGVRLNFQHDENCRTPLLAPSIHCEPNSQDLECIAILLDHGADSSLLEKVLPSTFFLVNLMRGLEMLLAAGVGLQKYGTKALHKHILPHKDDIVVWLLEHGVDANAPCKTYPNPLLTSVATPGAFSPYYWPATTRIIKSLIEHGADVQRFGQAALELARVSYSSPVEKSYKRAEDVLDQMEEMLRSDKS